MILTGITIESCSLIPAGPSISGYFPVLVSEAPFLSSTLMALSYQQLACCWSKNDASWRSQDAQWWVLSSPSLSGSRFISVPAPCEVSSPPRHLLHQESFSLSLWFSLSLICHKRTWCKLQQFLKMQNRSTDEWVMKIWYTIQHMKKQTTETCYNMHEPQRHYTNWREPATKSPFVWNTLDR